MSNNSLKNKNILVSGATRGIGLSIALMLSKLGAHVIGTSTSKYGSEKISEILSCYKGEGVILNINSVESINKLLNHLVKKNKKPHILINNAGIVKDCLSIKMKEENFINVINTNLISVFMLSKKILPFMIKNKWGRIINITSVVGSIGNIGQANYASSKSGLNGLSKSLAKELGKRNITVNCISPGFIYTEMTKYLDKYKKMKLLQDIPLGRFGKPDDVSKAVAFIASDESEYITGTTIHINGGIYM